MGALEKKIERIEKELDELRLIVLQQAPPKVRVSFEGMLKGVKISEADFRRAKKSLFPHARGK